ncbi:SpoIIE family protein phosphatase [Leptospira ilyithenensis]|uniref:Stage II sporulation protein E n=1 Tax=Leptospira ilyithenensis TaxID=2484901 RepID=A0A4V3JWU5_9LEPT|nr:SpoIIE family protein phosphatase [Leptospira ilyithenensis]TGN08398.1 stage II sporulation protein E [Leptospira ilyithenensis]
MKSSLFSFLFIFLLTLAELTAETAIPLQIENLDSPVSLDSEPGSESPWLAKEGALSQEEIQGLNFSDFNREDWKPVRVPGNILKDVPKMNQKKTVSLLKWVRLPKDVKGNLAVRLGVINDRDRIYINGNFLGGSGKWDSEEPQSYDKIRLYSIPDKFLNYGKENSILMIIQPYFDYTVGVEQDRTEIGQADKLFKDYYSEEYTKLLFLTIYLTVGGYFLFLFVRRRRESENFFFGLFSIGLVVYNLLRNQIKYEFGLSFLPMKQVEYIILVTLIPLMFHFIRKLFNYEYRLFYKILDAVELGFIVSFLFTSNIEYYNFMTTNVIQPTWLLYVIIIFYFLIKKIREKDRKAYYIMAGLVIIILATVLDILSTRGTIIFPRILGYFFLAFIVSLATILANSFVKLNEEVEDLNKNLERKVEERTNALNQTLKKVNELKDQQDGDYFLTSLLINPLARNDNKSQNILTEFYSKQKKKFEFRGKKHEIGGDICISSNLELSSRRYTVFVNADAMGKSIQGAGGALVLGVVFHAVLARSQTANNQSKSPETWLKEIFIELQTVFESFDGSMLLSLALGLIEENTGFLYYINAEHPWTILYRDEKASFIEGELWIRKLGIPKNDDSFFIQTLQLYPGDVLICGSDGRDDLALPTSSLENRVINEDETLILGSIEKSKADLNRIVEDLSDYGEFTDDLTLLKVTYLGPDLPKIEIPEHLQTTWEEAKTKAKSEEIKEACILLESIVKEIPEQESILSLLGQVYYKLKIWEDATNYLEKAIALRPEKEDLILLLSIAFRKKGDFTLAIDWGEKLFLRNPWNTKNTIHLTNLYWKSGNKKRGLSVLKKAMLNDKDNETYLELYNKLES